jgi:hypothetical protein
MLSCMAMTNFSPVERRGRRVLESTAVKLGRTPIIRGVWCRIFSFGSMIVELGASGSDLWGAAGVGVELCGWAGGWAWICVCVRAGRGSSGSSSIGADWHKAIVGERRTNKAKMVRQFLNRAGSSGAGKNPAALGVLLQVITGGTWAICAKRNTPIVAIDRHITHRQDCGTWRSMSVIAIFRQPSPSV